MQPRAKDLNPKNFKKLMGKLKKTQINGKMFYINRLEKFIFLKLLLLKYCLKRSIHKVIYRFRLEKDGKY